MNIYDLKIIPVGELQENCYILKYNNKTYMIDPGDEPEKIEKYIDSKIDVILITHHHFDHVGALEYFENKYKIKHNTNIDNEVMVLKTKGHTSDSLTFYFKNINIMFCGDFIFKNSIGRMDFPTGNELEMKQSLDMISKYNDDITLYPGHGEKTSLKEEKRHFKYYF